MKIWSNGCQFWPKNRLFCKIFTFLAWACTGRPPSTGENAYSFSAGGPKKIEKITKRDCKSRARQQLFFLTFWMAFAAFAHHCRRALCHFWNCFSPVWNFWSTFEWFECFLRVFWTYFGPFWSCLNPYLCHPPTLLRCCEQISTTLVFHLSALHVPKIARLLR